MKTLTGNTFSAVATAFVVATGGLEVPRLLLASNDRRPAGIGNEHDLVGRRFMEHVNIAAGPVALTSARREIAPYTPTSHTVDVERRARATSRCRRCSSSRPTCSTANELRHCEVTLEYRSPPTTPPRGDLPGHDPGHRAAAAEGVTTKTVATARVLCEQEPTRRAA